MRDKNQPLIELKGVDAAYNDDLVLKDVDLRIYEDDFIGMIGPNGGGKTTLVRVIMGLLKPLRGLRKDYMTSGNESQPIGYLPQVSDIDKKFPISVRQVIESGLMNRNRLVRRFSAGEHKQVSVIMEEMDISPLQHKPIGELSGGQLQRVFLARAIVSSPRLLILDEPNTFVDNAFESELYNRLRELNRDMAIVMVSHDVGMISPYVKTIACVNRELHYHQSNVISEEQLKAYNCPIQLITHGDVPHTVLKKHNH
jgi:zinc transport system ATP-binding protein